jgi:hypothetical protein
MIWGIFPYDPEISYESHFFGAVIGVVLAIVLKNRDPAPPAKKYSWEEEEDALAKADAAQVADSAPGDPTPF